MKRRLMHAWDVVFGPAGVVAWVVSKTCPWLSNTVSDVPPPSSDALQDEAGSDLLCEDGTPLEP
jgi:hypothetical protein